MEHQLEVVFQARYYTLGQPRPHHPVWLVLHGYGQLAQYFLPKFEYLQQLGHAVIAPEGLSRFYLNGFSGRVGASWMTRENRQTDIENYLRYLNTLVANCVPPQAKLYVLGFSQGAATASRFIAQSSFPVQAYVQWAGKFPPDVPLEGVKLHLTNQPIRLIHGTDDEFINPADIGLELQLFNKLSNDVQYLTFTGKHTITTDGLQKVLKSLNFSS